MLNLKWIRENPQDFVQSMKRRGLDVDVNALLALDNAQRHLVAQIQSLQEERNTLARQIPEGKKRQEDVTPLIGRANEIKDVLPSFEKEEHALKEQIAHILHHTPNLLAADTPEGLTEQENTCIRTWGTLRAFEFEPKSHDVLGLNLGLMRFDLGVAMSGSRFVALKGKLAKLERALGQFMLDLHTNTYGYEEISPPLLVREEAAFGVGQLPKFEEDLFKTTTGHYLIPTAEVPLTNLVAGQILEEKNLPLRFTALTPCFRSEAGAAGRDTKGMIRMHQFYKVELVSITTPDQAQSEHERMLGAAEDVLKRLGLPYRIMLLCGGDTGFSSQKTYDIEVWLPAQQAYREISSCSTFADYQARRLQTRFRPTGEKTSPALVHTLNGSGLAVGRTLVAILENYQNADGSITIPTALIPYTGFEKI